MAKDTYVAAAALGLAGMGLVYLGLRGGTPPGYPPGTRIDALGPIGPLAPGESLQLNVAAFRQLGAPVDVVIGEPIVCPLPRAAYAGPGRDAYSYFRIVQQLGGEWVTVQASGVAGVHLFAASLLVEADLVPPNQPEPEGCPAQALCAYVWPGPAPAPICGGPPQPGLASLVLEVYERRTAADADGYSAPTCNARLPVQRAIWWNLVRYQVTGI